MAYRGYISHCMWGKRSVPQNVQQQIIRQYCEKNGLQFLLSATEFEGQTIMLDAIKEHGIVMYSIFCMPKDKKARKKLYNSGKEVHFAAENMTMNRELVEIAFYVSEYHGGNVFPDSLTSINQTQLS